jgi:eukaryotic-like serine/threonine-protein kinase
LRRVVCASAARACDALLREEIAELSDVFLEVACQVGGAHDLSTMGEASMDHDAASVFRAYATLVQTTELAAGQAGRMANGSSIRTLGQSFPLVGSPRVEALRMALLSFADAVEGVETARCLPDLSAHVSGGASRIGVLADAARSLAQLVVGARRRLGSTTEIEPRACASAVRMIDLCLDHALRGSPDMLGEILPSAVETLRKELPEPIADVAVRSLERIQDLPQLADSVEEVPLLLVRAHKDPPLPVWLPPSRTLGGFYVVRPLGAGAVGSVFVACRIEDKNRRHAPKVALKVPEYGGDVARTLSEKEFLQLFREEAGTLLTLPQHPNLARLITFDAGAIPKPILVMELVEGTSLDRLIEAHATDTQGALAILDGICAGLETLHDAGVGHLDLKPHNVILREYIEPSPPSVDLSASRLVALPRSSEIPQDGTIPVLVDFGLAGRKLRPGCATAAYGAPEIWGQSYE